MEDDVAVGWLMNMTLELGSDFMEEGIPFDKATFEVAEEGGVTRMNLVTWDLSSVLARFTAVLLMSSAFVRTWGTPELLSDGTTVFLTNEACKLEPGAAVCENWPIVVATAELAEVLGP